MVLLTLVITGIIGYIVYQQKKSGPGSIRDQEIAALRALYDDVVNTDPVDLAQTERSLGAFFDALEVELSHPLRKCLRDVIDGERTGQRPDFDNLTFKEQIELRAKLTEWKRIRGQAQEESSQFLHDTFLRLAVDLPKTSNPSPFNIPFVYAVKDVGEFISTVYARLVSSETLSVNLFARLTERMARNICAASDIDFADRRPTRPYKQAYKSDLPLERLNDTYMRGTPFHKLLKHPVPLKFTQEDRFSHMHVISGSGGGKTTLIENLVRYDMRAPNRPALVIIEPHSELVRKLFETETGVSDRIILLDPRDVEFPLAINPFALNRERFATYDQATKEQFTSGVLQTYEYLFSGLFNVDLTGKQAVPFGYLAQLLMTIPEVRGENGTIIDMLRALENPEAYKDVIDALPPNANDFFVKDFMPKDSIYKETKQQIRSRLHAVLRNPTMERIFSAQENKVDFFTEMNRGSIILVDTAKGFLKTEGSSAFGRTILAMVFQSVLERSSPGAACNPAFVFVDEAQEFMSEHTAEFLREARKFNVGLVLSHQDMSRVGPELRAAIASSTGIKFASRLSHQDGNFMAGEMRTTSAYINSRPVLNFAAYIRDVTTTAVTVPVGIIEAERYSEATIRELRNRNRDRVSLGKQPSVTRTTAPKHDESNDSMQVPNARSDDSKWV